MPQLGFDFVTPSGEQERLLRAGRGLPDDQAGLVREARLTLRGLNAAIVKRDPEYRAHLGRLRAITGKYGDELDLTEALRAPNGQVPTWGQAGRFVMIAAECRMWIDWPGADGDLGAFEAYAIDFDRPFLTTTGYCDFGAWFAVAEEGMGVRAYVKRRLLASRRRMIGGKWHVQPLDEIYENIYAEDEPPGPPQDDPAWQEGGWLFAYVKSHPLPAEG
jgi:hypothetical protein